VREDAGKSRGDSESEELEMGLKAGRSMMWMPVSVVALAVAFAIPATASAAAPTASTGGAGPTTPTTTVLHGTVNPEGHATTYFFQYGTTSIYGAQTASASAGSGHSGISVTSPVTGLVPNTLYHYRIVAQYSAGLVKGGDRTFRTKKQPLGLSLGAAPNPVSFGGPVTLTGALTGTGNAGRTVVLQSNPFPYIQGFVNVGNAVVTNPDGGFAFPIISATITTQYRVFLQADPAKASPVLTLGVAFGPTIHVSSHHVRRGHTIRFSGTLVPGLSGVEMVIQRLHRRTWSTVGRTLSRHHTNAPTAKYAKRVRIRRGGKYRVEARTSGGAYVTGDTSIVTIRTHR
jgi:hypothetical protein